MFAWFTYDSAPSITILNPVAGTSFNSGDPVVINATVTDNINLSAVWANVTYPNGTIEQLTMLDSEGDDVYNVTFTNAVALGNYLILVIANDSNNQLTTDSTNFTVLFDDSIAPITTLNLPVDAYNSSSF